MVKRNRIIGSATLPPKKATPKTVLQEEDDDYLDGSSDESGSIAGDDDEEDGDLEDFHDRLLNAIDRFSKPDAQGSKGKSPARPRNQDAPESVFSSSADSDAVSMNALLNALDDTRNLSAVKKSLTELERNISAPKYVEKVVSERVERSLTYDASKKDMAKWQDTVTENRHVKTLDLAQDKRQLPSYKSMVKNFEPTTALEKEINMVLIKTQGTDDAVDAREVDELKRGNLSMKEIREKQTELAKVKALMFYEQMKRHRLNKIKSKAYHRIRKRQRLKREGEGLSVTDIDDDAAVEEQEKQATKRVEERMNLRHKNTSKWAKMALQHAQADKSLRTAYHESVLLGQELTKRIEADPLEGKDERDGNSDDEDEADGGDSGSRNAISSKAAKAIAKVLDDEDQDGGADSGQASGRYAKLLSMDFMKRAADKQKEQAREEAQALLRELRQMEAEERGDGDEGDLRPADLEAKAKAAAVKKAAHKELLREARREMDALLTGSATAGEATGMALRPAGKQKKFQSSSWSALVESVTESTASIEGDAAAPKVAALSTESEKDQDAAFDAFNPWLSLPSDNSRRGEGKKSNGKRDEDAVRVQLGSKSSRATRNEVDVAVAVVSRKQPGVAPNVPAKKSVAYADDSKTAIKGDGPEKEVPVETKATAKSSKLPERKPLLMQKSQADLVQLAFAGPDLEAEFRSLKDRAVDDELGIDERKQKVISDVKAGWGDWAGPGATGISQRTLNKRDKLLRQIADDSDQKRAGRKDTKMFNVVLSEKRVKSSAKYKIAAVPHPFTSREEYERSIQVPLGDEWNASHVVRSNTRPDVLLRAGRIVEPISLPKKRTSDAKDAMTAKFQKR